MLLSIIVFLRILLNSYWCTASLEMTILELTHSRMAKVGSFLSALYFFRLCSNATFIGMA
ncbi:hypothetical protein PHJA_000965400 [Phtheirospermum japonicum]|uniref:Uncharacterized protein n=1 Tax=Phtheirospermum japonicum TaxID=374723 RepID=A0A830BL74_9LAMI|nr:hypothetical protein PHJA_000965400 [Phtheirospermum japonicum]